ncbi:MAG: hypothetical protein J7K40_03955, partial [candidate division Zixibacteria bacterium]|nr:hypothetical protein [candidate division Zixibacteria bacterium]
LPAGARLSADTGHGIFTIHHWFFYSSKWSPPQASDILRAILFPDDIGCVKQMAGKGSCHRMKIFDIVQVNICIIIKPDNKKS